MLALSIVGCVARDGTGEATRESELSTVTIPLDPHFIVDGPEGFQAAYLWTGFHHAWSRSSHRLGNFANFIDEEFHELQDPRHWRASANAHFTFTVGNEGDRSEPKASFDFIRGPGLHIARGARTLLLNDEATCVGDGLFDGPKRCIASAASNQPLSIDLSTARLEYGTLDHYVVVLRGWAIDNMECGENCPKSMWPTALDIKIGDCTKQGTTLSCPSTIFVERANAPDKLKEFNDRMSYHVTVEYTVIGGNSDALAVRSAHLQRESRDIHQDIPVRSDSVVGTPGFSSAALALRHFRWRINDNTNPVTSDFFARGRYIGEYRFEVNPVSYDPATGTLGYQWAAGLNAGALVHDALIDYELESALLQFNGGSLHFAKGSASGQVCDPTLYLCGSFPVTDTSLVPMTFTLSAP